MISKPISIAMNHTEDKNMKWASYWLMLEKLDNIYYPYKCMVIKNLKHILPAWWITPNKLIESSRWLPLAMWLMKSFGSKNSTRRLIRSLGITKHALLIRENLIVFSLCSLWGIFFLFWIFIWYSADRSEENFWILTLSFKKHSNKQRKLAPYTQHAWLWHC